MATQTRQRILIFLPFLTYGGAERQGFLLAESLHKTPGYEVEVWGFELPGGKYPLIADLQALNIPYYTLPFGMQVMRGRKSLLKAWLAFVRLVRQKQFTAIVPFTYWPNFLTALAARFTGARCFWNQRGVDDHAPKLRAEGWLPLNRLSFISNSNPGRHFLHRRFGINQAQIALIPNSVIPLVARNSAQFWKDKLQLQNELVITMVANFYPEKDFDTVLKAALLLRRRGLPCRFVFAGGGPDKNRMNQLKAFAYDNDLGHYVTFLNDTNDVGGVLQVTDIGLLSSTSEGCPNSVLEYMQAGLPVIGNNIEAITDVVGTHYAYIFETGNAESLAGKIELLAQSKELRQQTGQQLKMRVQEAYSHQKMIDSYLALFNNQ